LITQLTQIYGGIWAKSKTSSKNNVSAAQVSEEAGAKAQAKKRFSDAAAAYGINYIF
jgi:hypothetical protein